MHHIEVFYEDQWRPGQRIRRGTRNSRVRYSLGEEEIVDLFPNDQIRDVDCTSQQDDPTERIVPITPLRSLYWRMRNVSGGLSTRFGAIEEMLSPVRGLEAASFIGELWSRSVGRFESYKNQESFVCDSQNRTQDPRRSGFARRLVDQWRTGVPPYEPFAFVEYELSPYRTTGSCFENGESARPSGLGGIDMILSDRGVPVVTEVKASTETVGPTFALVQAITYAAELVSEGQQRRLFGAYPDQFSNSSIGKLKICVVVERPIAAADGDMECAQQLASDLMEQPAFEKRVESIVFLGGKADEQGSIVLDVIEGAN